MKRIALFLLLDLIFLAAAASATPRKHWYHDPKWWVGEAVIAAAIAADAHSTVRNLNNGYHENNPLLGRYPSTGKVAGFALLDFSAQTTYHALAWHFTHHVPLADSCLKDVWGHETCHEFTQDRLGWRIIGYVGIPLEVSIINGRAAYNNYRLPEPKRCHRTVQECR